MLIALTVQWRTQTSVVGSEKNLLCLLKPGLLIDALPKLCSYI
ncbi:hypothetical protein CORMATOL_00478 [Corynebacterium matruchotii ATCC 33806]|uniref:Uncharacterized protein n=1 Tax=Corynebacterium matruchotii ATCC 33806 TaxID=566549 RepID=C0E0H7_9CORY|nr:hypothetical protein CORMATOL_00478 [Corynebacterium matruchotii ATCC 33806]